MKTYIDKKSDIAKKWYLVDADGKVLGRVATKVASVLRGKHKPTYTPFLDMGDNVVVIAKEILQAFRIPGRNKGKILS